MPTEVCEADYGTDIFHPSLCVPISHSEVILRFFSGVLGVLFLRWLILSSLFVAVYIEMNIMSIFEEGRVIAQRRSADKVPGSVPRICRYSWEGPLVLKPWRDSTSPSRQH